MMMIEQILGDADDNFANDSNASDDLGVCVDGEGGRSTTETWCEKPLMRYPPWP